jgi:hypothetical protein
MQSVRIFFHVQALLYHFILTMMKQGMVSEGAVLETASGYVNLGGGGLSIEGIPVNLWGIPTFRYRTEIQKE